MTLQDTQRDLVEKQQSQGLLEKAKVRRQTAHCSLSELMEAIMALENRLAAARARCDEGEEKRRAMEEVIGVLQASVDIDTLSTQEPDDSIVADAAIMAARKEVENAAAKLKIANDEAILAEAELERVERGLHEEREHLQAEIRSRSEVSKESESERALYVLARQRMQRQAAASNLHDGWKTKANILLQTLDLRARLLQACTPQFLI